MGGGAGAIAIKQWNNLLGAFHFPFLADYISAGVGGLSVVLSWLWSVARNPPINPLGSEVFIGPNPEKKDDSSLDPNEQKESKPLVIVPPKDQAKEPVPSPQEPPAQAAQPPRRKP